MHWKHSPGQVPVEGKTLHLQSWKSNSAAVAEPGVQMLQHCDPALLSPSQVTQQQCQPLPAFRAVAPVLSLALGSAITQRCISINCENSAQLYRGYLVCKLDLPTSSKNSVSDPVDFFLVHPGRVSWINLWQLCWVKEPLTPNSQSSSSPDGFQQAELY